MGGLATIAGAGVGWERKRKKPSVDRLSQLVAIVRCTRQNLVARHYRFSAIPRQIPNLQGGPSRVYDQLRLLQASMVGPLTASGWRNLLCGGLDLRG